MKAEIHLTEVDVNGQSGALWCIGGMMNQILYHGPKTTVAKNDLAPLLQQTNTRQAPTRPQA